MDFALVTGASRGIGHATALELATQGYNVIVHYGTNADKAKETVSQIEKLGRRAFSVQADLSVESEVERMFSIIDEAPPEFGHFKALVNNGGVSGGRTPLNECDYTDLQKIFATNVFSVFVTIRETVKRMKKHGQGGAIVNVSSEAAKFGGNMITPYASTKGAVDTLTRGLSRELGPFNIRINAVSPGVIETDAHGEISDERRSFLNGTIPLGRLGRPDEVAKTIAWLLRDASYVTGGIVTVSGGR